MKNIYSNIFKLNKKNLLKSIYYLKSNNLVALPTETVYGLAGNAYSNKSVKKIYSLKKRPKINPLIVHYYSMKDVHNDVVISQKFLKLYKNLCPGPITFILKKKKYSKISNLVTANLNTVAVRFPNNVQTRKILKKIKFPLAIPSANKSSGVSPVDALDVANEFKKKIKMIINGGRSKIGVESTVLDLTGKVKILRPGKISVMQISKILKEKVFLTKTSKKIKSPGSLKKHYSPGIPIKINQIKAPSNVAFITFGKKYKKFKNIFNLSKKSDLNEAAKNLYKIFNQIKKLKYNQIYITKIPEKGIGVAINDRIKRAAN
jgi:L-threonylcarbamoyladenylate synthase